MKFLRKVVFFKAEAIYGTDPVPVAATDAILCAAVRITPLTLDKKKRSLVLPYFGNQGNLVAGQYAQIELDVEMCSGGAAGDAPAYGDLFLGCALGKTVNAGVSVVYAPISSAEGSTTFYWFNDGIQHKITGARGDVSWSLKKGDTPMWTFKFIGLYNGPADVALPSPDLSAYRQPLEVNNVNTTPFTIHAYAAAKLYEMTGSLGNAMKYRNVPGAEEIYFADRQAVSNFVIQAPLVADKDFFTIAKGGTAGTVSCTHGTAGGDKVKIDYSNFVPTDIGQYQDLDGITGLPISGDVKPSSAGNDEATFTFL